MLADRAKAENVAKSLIFLPMAVSFVGAGIIWRLVYQPRNVSKPQTGVLNAAWIGLAELSNSGWQKWLVFILGLAILAGFGYIAMSGIRIGNWTRAGWAIGIGLLVLLFVLALVTRGLGGFVKTDGQVTYEFVDFVGEPAVQQHVADGRAHLDPDRVRDGDLLIGDQGCADRLRWRRRASTAPPRRRRSGG